MTCQVTEQVGATGPRPLLTPAPEPAAPGAGAPSSQAGRESRSANWGHVSGIHGALSDGAICFYFWAPDYALTVSEWQSPAIPRHAQVLQRVGGFRKQTLKTAT